MCSVLQRKIRGGEAKQPSAPARALIEPRSRDKHTSWQTEWKHFSKQAETVRAFQVELTKHKSYMNSHPINFKSICIRFQIHVFSLEGAWWNSKQVENSDFRASTIQISAVAWAEREIHFFSIARAPGVFSSGELNTDYFLFLWHKSLYLYCGPKYLNIKKSWTWRLSPSKNCQGNNISTAIHGCHDNQVESTRLKRHRDPAYKYLIWC